MKQLLALFAAAAVSSHAAILVQWDFTTNASGTIVSSSVASVADLFNVGSAGSRQSSGFVTNLPAGGNSGSGLAYVAPYAEGTAAPLSPTNAMFYGANGFGTSPVDTSYISVGFTLGPTVASADAFLEGIQFDLANGGTSGPRGVEVTYRVGTVGSFLSLGTTAVPNNTANNYGRFSFTVPGSIALSASDVVEFRLLGYSNASGNSIRLDNVAVSAIPEPSTYAAFLAVGALAVLALRRRRS